MSHPADAAAHRRRGWIGAELWALVVLAAPIAASNLAEMAMSVANVVMMGRLGATELAAGGFGHIILWLVMVVAFGVILAVGTLVAQANGAGDREAAGRALAQGLLLATAMSLPSMVALWWAGPVVALSRIDPEVTRLMTEYLRAVLWALPLILWFVVLQRFVASLFRPLVLAAINVVAVFGNIFLNWLLIYGNWGFPALGVAGAGYATTIVSALQFVAALVYVARHLAYRPYRPFATLFTLHWATLREILHVGWPIAGGLAVEYWFFAATGLLVAQFGTASLAAHQLVVNFTSIFYMVVMAVANAANFRVAHAMGRGSLIEVRRSGGLAIAVGMGLGAVMVVVLWAFPRPIVGFYLDLDDPASLGVLPIAISLLAIAAIFQVGDAVQAVAAGALRGLRDTRASMWAAVLGYWVIGVGCGLGLGYGAGLGAIGLWWGIAAGLSAAGAALALRFDRRTRALLRSAQPAEAMP